MYRELRLQTRRRGIRAVFAVAGVPVSPTSTASNRYNQLTRVEGETPLCMSSALSSYVYLACSWFLLLKSHDFRDREVLWCSPPTTRRISSSMSFLGCRKSSWISSSLQTILSKWDLPPWTSDPQLLTRNESQPINLGTHPDSKLSRHNFENVQW